MLTSLHYVITRDIFQATLLCLISLSSFLEHTARRCCIKYLPVMTHFAATTCVSALRIGL